MGGANEDNIANVGNDQVFWISSGTTTFDSLKIQNVSGVDRGAIRNNSGNIIFNNNTTFENILAQDGNGAGAFATISSGTNIFNGETQFINNTTALVQDRQNESAEAGSITVNNKVSFVGNSNSGNRHGGAIRNDAGTITFAKVNDNTATLFNSNNSTDDGGAVYNAGNMTFEKNVTFSGNGSTTQDVLHNAADGTLTFNQGISYTNNGNAEYGTLGTFTNKGITNIAGNAIFKNTNGQAIQNDGTFTISGAKNITISGSTDGAFGSTTGAIATLTADNINISNNETVSGYSTVFNMGGNAYFYGKNNNFSNNVLNTTSTTDIYKLGGGALQNRANGANTGIFIIGLEDKSM